MEPWSARDRLDGRRGVPAPGGREAFIQPITGRLPTRDELANVVYRSSFGFRASRRSVERERINRCLLFAMCHGTGTRSPRASLALATPEPAGAWAAMTALESGAHVDALALIDELVALGSRRGRWWQRVAGPRDEDMSRV